MKYGSSIRYGGLLVEADQCNHNSYKQLGLICPECSKNIFWRSSTERQGYTTKKGTKVKSTKVPAYFSHFPEVKEEESELCENRVKSYGEEGVKRSEFKAKAQRKQEFEQRFSQMLTFNPVFGMNVSYLIKAAELDLIEWLKSQKVRLSLVNKYRKIYASAIRGHKLQLQKVLKAEYQKDSGDLPIEDRLHLQVCLEVVDYLYQPSNQMFEHLVLLGIYLASICLKKEAKIATGQDLHSVVDVNTLIFQDAFINGSSLIFKPGSNNTVLNQVGIDKTLEIIGRLIIYQTLWSEAFCFFDRANTSPVKPSKLHYYNLTIKDEQQECLMIKCLSKQLEETWFNFNQSRSIGTTGNGTVQSVFKLNSQYNKVKGNSDPGLERIFKQAKIDPTSLFFMIEGYYTEIGQNQFSYKAEAVLVTCDRAFEELTFDIIAEESKCLLSGFFYSNMFCQKSRNGFLRRFKKLGLSKENLDYAAPVPGAVIEYCWNQDLAGFFADICIQFLSTSMTFAVQK